MTVGVTWRERADRQVGRCPACDHYTWRGRCPRCQREHREQDQRKEQR